MYAPNYASLGSYSLQAQCYSRLLHYHCTNWSCMVILNGDKHELNWIIDADEAGNTTNTGNIYRWKKLSASSLNRQMMPGLISIGPITLTSAQYRLNVTFDNGHQYYSNVVTLR